MFRPCLARKSTIVLCKIYTFRKIDFDYVEFPLLIGILKSEDGDGRESVVLSEIRDFSILIATS